MIIIIGELVSQDLAQFHRIHPDGELEDLGTGAPEDLGEILRPHFDHLRAGGEIWIGSMDKEEAIAVTLEDGHAVKHEIDFDDLFAA